MIHKIDEGSYREAEKKTSTVTVIVPVYNVALYVEKCIESIREQTYKNLEIIIIDDGSTDGSSELCDKIAVSDKRIKVFHQLNAGVVMARKKGVELANGKYISFVDGDDWIDSDTIEHMVMEIGEADLLTTGVYEEVSYGNVIESYDEYPEGLYSGEIEMAEIRKTMIYDFAQERLQRLTPWGVNKLFLCSLVKEVYKELDPEITFAEDTVFVYKYLLRCHSIIIHHQCFYHYRYREGSALHTINKHMLINVNKVYLSLESEFMQHPLNECLLLQLQKWILLMNYWAINIYMGFDKRIYIPEFIADLSGMENKKLIIYGAGKVGKITYAQIKQFGYPVVLWVDKDYEYYQKICMPVVEPDEILKHEYDFVLIAVSTQNLAKKIRQELVKKGIPDNKLVWKEPMHIFKI